MCLVKIYLSCYWGMLVLWPASLASDLKVGVSSPNRLALSLHCFLWQETSLFSSLLTKVYNKRWQILVGITIRGGERHQIWIFSRLYLHASIATCTDDVVCIHGENGIIDKWCMSTEFLQGFSWFQAMHSTKMIQK